MAEGPPAITVTKPDQGAVAVRPGAKPKASTGASSMLVRVARGQSSYAGVLGKIRKDLNPDTCSAKIVCARPTPKGDVILRLGKGSDRQKFTVALGAAVSEVGNVVAPEKRVSVDARDLDSLTEKLEVVGAIDKFFGGSL